MAIVSVVVCLINGYSSIKLTTNNNYTRLKIVRFQFHFRLISLRRRHNKHLAIAVDHLSHGDGGAAQLHVITDGAN